jgi:glycosyltransferase involved in cell wall biosynthesis
MGGIDPRRSFGRPDLVVYNSDWRHDQDRWPGASVVVHPPVVADDYRTTPGDAYTLIGLSERKGVSLFYALAARCPQRSFVGVKGGWGDQVVPDPLPTNVTILENTRDMRSVYGRTRVLLVPSQHESFGRVGVEAGVSGIPTIAAPGPGVEEALGAGALYAPADDPDAWVRLLDRLDDAEFYDRQSVLAREQAESWDFEAELDRVEEMVLYLVTRRTGAADDRH